MYCQGYDLVTKPGGQLGFTIVKIQEQPFSGVP